MKAINASKSLVIASNLREATGFFARAKGLIGLATLKNGEGLWMAHCRAIHTIGMRFPIDVIFTDKGFVVKKVMKEVRPFCPLVCCLSAEEVFELPVGTIERANIQAGDKIEIIRAFE